MITGTHANGHPLHGRRKPYTPLGISRLPCFRCGQPARHQWSVCSDGNIQRPLCVKCDVDLNELVLHWMGHPDAEQLSEEYRKRELGNE